MFKEAENLRTKLYSKKAVKVFVIDFTYFPVCCVYITKVYSTLPYSKLSKRSYCDL